MIKPRSLRYQFLLIFRAPQDIHRVISALFLSVTFSHIYFLWAESVESVVPTTKIESVLIGLIAGVLAFQVLWAFLSTGLNVKLYIRQFVVIGWGILAHRLGYGVEILGSVFVTVMLLMGWTIWIPFALTGMRFDELQTKIEVWQDAKKRKSTIVDNFHVDLPSNGERPTVGPN